MSYTGISNNNISTVIIIHCKYTTTKIEYNSIKCLTLCITKNSFFQKVSYMLLQENTLIQKSTNIYLMNFVVKV